MEELVFRTVIEAADAAKTLGEVKGSIKAITEELNKVPVGSKAFGELTVALGKAKANMTDLREQVKALDPEKRFAAIARVGSSIASGFAAAQGAVALFGSQSEDLNRVLVKVQASMALAQGLQGLAGFGKALQTARLAMIAFAASNPFTMIALAITALVGVIAGLVSAYKDANSEAAMLEEVNKKLTKSYEDQRTVLENEIKILEAYGTKQDEVILKKRELLVLKAKEQYLALAQAQANLKEAESISILDGWMSAFIGEGFIKKRIESAKEEVKINKQKLNDIQTDMKVNFIQEDKLYEDAAKKRAGLLDNLRPDIMLDDPEKDPFLIVARKHGEMTDAMIESNMEFGVSNKDFWDNQKKQAEDYVKYREALLQAELSLEQAKWTGLTTLANIGQQLAGKNKQMADTFFAIEKALAIAGIVVSTQKEISGYYANPTWKLMPDGGIGLASAASAAAKIRAATSIATILATSIQRFMGGGSASVGAPSISTPNLSSPQNNDATFQQNQATTVVKNEQGDATGFGGKSGERNSQRVYVLETDITNTQKTIARIERNSTY